MKVAVASSGFWHRRWRRGRYGPGNGGSEELVYSRQTERGRKAAIRLAPAVAAAAILFQPLQAQSSFTLPGVERRVAVAPAETLFVADAGTGDPVVLIPGLLGSAYQFRRIAPLLLEEGFRVIAVEPIGVGRGSRPDEVDYSLTAQADRVVTLLDSLGIGQAFLAAHSVGGSVALRAAYRNAGRIRGVLLMEAGATESATTPSLRTALKFDWLIKLFGGMSRIRGKVRGGLRDNSANPAWVTEEVVEGYMIGATDDVDTALRGLKSFAAAEEPDSLAPNLHRITAPVFMLLGGHPHDSSPQQVEIDRMLERLPAFVMDTVPNVGHFPHEEAPSWVIYAMLYLRDASRCMTSSGGVDYAASCLRKQ